MKTAVRNVYLMGFMGCGKTRVGALLAEALRRPFIDTDGHIVEETGQSVNAIFEQRGEAAFREIESNVVHCLARTEGCVISLGGGAVMAPDNWKAVSSSGITVALSYPPELLAERLSRKQDRPLLRGLSAPERVERIRSLLAERESVYRQADLVVHFNRETKPESVAALVAEYVKGRET